MLLRQDSIPRFSLFHKHLNLGKVLAQSGPLEFVELLAVVAFGDEQQPVPLRELSQGVGHAGEQFNLLLGDRVDEADDTAMSLIRDRRRGELFEACDE